MQRNSALNSAVRIFHRHKFASNKTIVNDAVCDRLRKLSENGQLEPPLELAIDAASVFTTIAAEQVTDPAECSLKVHVLSLREAVAHGRLRVLWWIDTRDMLSDALTKGGIDRAAIEAAMEKGQYSNNHEPMATTKTAIKIETPVDVLESAGVD